MAALVSSAASPSSLIDVLVIKTELSPAPSEKPKHSTPVNFVVGRPETNKRVAASVTASLPAEPTRWRASPEPVPALKASPPETIGVPPERSMVSLSSASSRPVTVMLVTMLKYGAGRASLVVPVT